ncbi:hypothetical protein MRX96_010610 [Rhipicephalus microplus]
MGARGRDTATGGQMLAWPLHAPSAKRKLGPDIIEGREERGRTTTGSADSRPRLENKLDAANNCGEMDVEWESRVPRLDQRSLKRTDHRGERKSPQRVLTDADAVGGGLELEPGQRSATGQASERGHGHRRERSHEARRHRTHRAPSIDSPQSTGSHWAPDDEHASTRPALQRHLSSSGGDRSSSKRHDWEPR